MPDIRYFEVMTPEPRLMAAINGQLVTKTVNEQTIIFRVRDTTSGREWAFAVSKEMVDNRPAEETLHYAAESLARRMLDSVYDQELDVDGYTPGVAVEAHQRYNRQFAERAPRWYDGQVGRPAEGGLVSDPAWGWVNQAPRNDINRISFAKEETGSSCTKVKKRKSVIRMIRFRMG